MNLNLKQMMLRTMIATLVPTVSLWAQGPVSDAQNKLLARRAAEVDCYRKLGETVYGVQINSETYVRDFVTESDQIRAALDTFVKGIRLGPPRYYEDGICEVEGEVTVAKLITSLKAVHKAHYQGRRWTVSDIESIRQRIATEVIRVTGSGAPRPDLPPNLPEGIEDVITPLPSGYATPPRVIPALWRTVSPQARLMAERAARIDALRKLLERIKGLRLTSETLVRDFVTESDQITANSRGLVAGAREVGTYLHDDELIVEVTMEVPVERVVTTISQLHTRFHRGRRLTETDILNIKKRALRRTVSATGSGVPPQKFVAQARAAGVEMPDWFEDRIEAVGQGTDPEIATSAQGRLRAQRAATLDAMRKLAEQVYGLQVRSETSVRDFITEYDEIRTQVQAVIRGAVVDKMTVADDTATARVSIPAAGVWSVINDHRQIIERRGS